MSVLVCRTCLYVNQDLQAFKSITKVTDILKLIVPEIDYYPSYVVCFQCYYFLKNIAHFKNRCTEAQKRLVSINVEQIQLTARKHYQEPESEQLTFQRLSKNLPIKTYSNKKKKINYDLQIQLPWTRQIRHNTTMHPECTGPGWSQRIKNYKGTTENQIHNNQTPVTTECTNSFTPEVNRDPANTSENSKYRENVSKERHPSFNNSEELRMRRFQNSTDNIQITNVESVPDYNMRSQVSINKVSEPKQIEEYDISPRQEVIFDLAELISSKADEELPQCDKIQQTDTTVEAIIQPFEIVENIENVIQNEIIEIRSDSEVELNDFSTIDQEHSDEDDIFEEKITILKNEVESEDNPSFFNKQTENGSYDCKLCSKKYKTSKGLYEHTQMKHPELKFYHCEICNFFTLWKSALNRHIDLFHSIQEVNTLEFVFCYHCSYRTASKDVLQQHLMNMHFSNNITTLIP